jgi:hypothetical protein
VRSEDKKERSYADSEYITNVPRFFEEKLRQSGSSEASEKKKDTHGTTSLGSLFDG